jgi:hypothetical protein
MTMTRRQPFLPSNPFDTQDVVGAATVPPSPSYSITVAPTGGVALAESTNFEVTFENLTGPVIVTPASDDPGGSFTPATVTGDVGDLVKNHTYTPDGSLGTHTISWTNDSGLSDPAPRTYEVTAVPSGSAGEPIGLLLALTKAA